MIDPERLPARIEAALGVDVTAVTEFDGGEIGRAFRVALAEGDPIVAKVGDTPLTVEAAMLRYLGAETPLPVPAVRHAAADLLLMDFVAGKGAITPAVERDAADRLAALHDRTAAAAGFRFDTLSGPLRQPNPWTGSWIRFFGEARLTHVAERAREAGRIDAALAARVAGLVADLETLLTEPGRPTLVHGDVWRDNLVVRDGRVVAFLDPAIYFGHPEVELAYVRWTETFGEPFFDRYRHRRGIAPGFEDRYPVYTVLPVLEHAYCFGAPYPDRLRETLAGLGY